FTIVNPPQHGTLSAVVPDNPCTSTPPGVTCTAKVTYTPNPNFSGSDSFTFKVNDGSVDSNTATVTVNVGAVPDRPVATSQGPLVTPEDTPKLVTLSGMDVDGDALTFTLVTGPVNGTLGAFSAPSCQPIQPDGSRTCTADATYTPNLNYN